MLYQLDHPNIIKLFWHYEDAHCIYLLEEFGGLRLNLWIRNLKKNEVNLAPYIRQIALGLQTIHEAGFIHRDIMTKNILILNDKMVKIIDFGYTNTGISRKTKLGSFPYMAPEVTGESTYNHKADIWSFGFVIFEMYHKDYPFCSGRPGKFNEQTFI